MVMTIKEKERLAEVRQVNVLTDRVKKRKEAFLKARPTLMPERSRIFAESWRSTEGDTLNIRYAKAYASVLENVPVAIRPGELIVGSMSSEVRGLYAYPEWDQQPFVKDLQKDTFTSGGPSYVCVVAGEAKSSILEDCRYWEGKSAGDRMRSACREVFGEITDAWSEDRIWQPLWATPPGTKTVDYPRILRKGMNDVIAELEQELNKLQGFTADEVRKRDLLKASLICCKAVITFARRYARLAKELARKEPDLLRRQELVKIGEVLERVPAEPARTFQEALQSFWLCIIAVELQNAGSSPAVGRLDQYFYPFYAEDIKQGKISPAEAAELVALLLVKHCEMECFRPAAVAEAIQGTYVLNVSVGGPTAGGDDATNDVSYLILEAARQLKLPQPHISVLYHDKIGEDFLIAAAECNRDHGAGIPAWFNHKEMELHLVDHGVPLVEARERAIPIGCVESFLFLEGHNPRPLFFNLPKVLEFTLNNGVDPRTKKQWTPKTGDPRSFETWEQFYAAFLQQLQYVIDVTCKFTNLSTVVRGDNVRYPLTSAFMKGCIEQGVDWMQGGQAYHGNICLINPFGLQNTGNSLAAIKKVVYEDGKVTMSELLHALASNFEGKEAIRQLLLAAPKWGNDDDYVDTVVKDLFNVTHKFARQHVGAYGKAPFSVTRQGLTFHYSFGKVLGALPDGRKAWELLADGSVSAFRGTDTHGPTAIIRSAGKVDHITSESTLLNMKISPSIMQTREGLKKFLALIKTYFDLWGHHIQFTVIDRQTLLEARKHPEQYRDLVVRVAGYSAYFVSLAPEVQDEIIARTEQRLD